MIKNHTTSGMNAPWHFVKFYFMVAAHKCSTIFEVKKVGLDLIAIIKSIGYMGVWSIIFAETGILFGVLLPGDMLLFAVGVLAAQGTFDVTVMAVGCALAAFLGNLIGYEIGRYFGLPFVKKYASGFITDDHLAKTHAFFDRYGRSGLIVARFIPVARTVAPFLAGISRMDYRMFMIYSAIGAIVWGAGLVVAGYHLAGLIPHELIDYILLPIIAIIVFILAWPWIKLKLGLK
jgi:membrane-associated protein